MKNLEEYEVHAAVCFFADILEFGGQDLFDLSYKEAVDKFIEAIHQFKDDRDMIQSAGYGLGAIALRAEKGQLPHI